MVKVALVANRPPYGLGIPFALSNGTPRVKLKADPKGVPLNPVTASSVPDISRISGDASPGGGADSANAQAARAIPKERHRMPHA
jgi:hypothetical protein